MTLADELAPGVTGLEQLRAMIAAGGRPPIGETLDFSLVEAGDGTAVFAGTPGQHAYNPIGTVHGGYAATLLDSACGIAVHSKLAPGQGLATYVDFYLSAGHRDTRTAGCPLPFLSADAPRLAAPSRERFAQGVVDLTDRLAQILAQLGRADPEETAGSMLSEMVGAVALARAEPDPTRSDAILERTRASLVRRLDLEPVQ